MAVKPDRWIRRKALEHKMIEPFTDRQVREGVISYGVSSYGYDIRVADEFRIFTNVNSTIVDPKHFDPKSFVEFKGDVCIIPPNSFALARSVEYFRIPRNVLTICLGKSTYARCGIIVNVTPFEPGVQTAQQRAYARDAVLPEEQRHTGAGGFVWSSTVEDYFAVARQAVVLLFQLLGIHAESAGNGFRVGFEIHRVAQVNNNQFLAGVEFPFQFIHGDAGDAQITKKALASDKLISDVGGEDAEKKDQEPAAERGEMLGHAFDLTTEQVTKTEKRAGPEQRSQGIEQEETPRTHVKDARKGRGDRAQAGKKLCQQKRTRALFRENALGAANAGIRLQRNFAEKLENPDAFAAAKLVPDGIRCHGGKNYLKKRGEKT